MKFSLLSLTASIFLLVGSQNLFAMECKLQDIPWDGDVEVIGYDQCDEHNPNGSSCLDWPKKEEAIAQAQAQIEDAVIRCHNLCEIKGGQLSIGESKTPDCQYIRGSSKIDDYYRCSISTPVQCQKSN